MVRPYFSLFLTNVSNSYFRFSPESANVVCLAFVVTVTAAGDKS